jgi:hypothetical protein
MKTSITDEQENLETTKEDKLTKVFNFLKSPQSNWSDKQMIINYEME